MRAESLQTIHVLESRKLADFINTALSATRVGPGDYTPHLSAPEGMSTAGGEFALQHLRLVSAQGLPTLLVGTADHGQKKAELRSYEYVDAQHRQRYRKPLDLDRAQYAHFQEVTRNVLRTMGLSVALVEAPLDLGPQEPARRSPWPWVLGVLLLVALSFAAGAVAFRR